MKSAVNSFASRRILVVCVCCASLFAFGRLAWAGGAGNDTCLTANLAAEGANLSDNTGFGPDDAEASCQADSNHDAWFAYTAACDGQVQFTTIGSALAPVNDTVLSVFAACGGAELACDDDGGVGLLSALTITATADDTYFIRVAGAMNNVGPIQLNIQRLGTCLIEDVCHTNGTVNPSNECEICDSADSNVGWTPVFKGTACGNPGFGECDSPDACNGAGQCETNNKPDGTACSSDFNDCTQDICQAGACTHPGEPAGTACGDPTVTDCDNEDTCDGVDTCLSNPQPDGVECTPDANDCTDDICAAGLCTHPNEAFGTLCGDPTDTDCDNPDSCDGNGACLDNFEPDDTGCTPDTNDCTDDVCASGLCEHPNEPLGTFCGDPADDDCDNPDTCDGSGLCLDNLEPDGTTCNDGNVCTGPDLCSTGLCTAPFIPQAPIVTTAGSRRLDVTAQPAGSSVPQALRVTSPDHPCLVQYVGLTGQLQPSPVFQSALDWATLTAFGSEIVPQSTYLITAECGGEFSSDGQAETTIWGDVDVNGTVSLFDLFCMFDALSDIYVNCTFENVDLHPCTPNGTINLSDLFQVLNAFSDPPFPCAGPCGGGACCNAGLCAIADDAPSCSGTGGAYQGDGTNCLPNPCPP